MVVVKVARVKKLLPLKDYLELVVAVVVVVMLLIQYLALMVAVQVVLAYSYSNTQQHNDKYSKLEDSNARYY